MAATRRLAPSRRRRSGTAGRARGRIRASAASPIVGVPVAAWEVEAISDFELNTVIVSILVAFALSEILSSWGKLIESRARVRMPALYVGASVWLFFSLIIHWLGVSDYRDLGFERNYQSFLFFMPSVVGAASAYVLTPTVLPDGEIDLEQHYFLVGPWAFRLATVYVVLSAFSDRVVLGGITTPLPVVALLLGALLTLSFAVRPLLHRVSLGVLWAMFLLNATLATR